MFFVSILGEISYLCRAVILNNAAKLVIIFNSAKYFDDNFQLMAKILENLVILAQNEGITIGALEKIIGASKGVLSRAISNGTDIQAKWITRVVENYPQYSATWLLTGNGNMLREQSEYKDNELNSLLKAAINRIVTGKQKVKVVYPETYEDSVVANLLKLCSDNFSSSMDLAKLSKDINELNGELAEKSLNAKMYYDTMLQQAEEIGRLKARIEELERSRGASVSDVAGDSIARVG